MSASHNPPAQQGRCNVSTKKAATPRIVLALPLAVDALLTLGAAIHDSVAANPKQFPSPSPALTSLSTDLSVLQTQQVAVKNHTPGAVAARNTAEATVRGDLRQLKAYVQLVVAGDPANAAAIAQAAGMALAKSAAHPKATLTAKQTVSGTVMLVAKAVKGSHAYEWQYSTDGGKTWVAAPASTKAQTAIPGLLPGSTVLFRHRPVLVTGPQDWGQAIQAIVS